MNSWKDHERVTYHPTIDDRAFCNELKTSLDLFLYPDDFEFLGRFARCYKKEFDEFIKPIDSSPFVKHKPVPPPTKSLQTALFPFIPKLKAKSVFELYNSYQGRGIVMTSGNEDIHYSIVNIRLLRKVLNCQLPIEFFYFGNEDLHPEYQKRLQVFDNVKLIDVSKLYLDSTIVGFPMKLFSILLSSFEEVMLLDADAFFFRNPEELFDHDLFQSTGALFFRDRSIRYNYFEDPGIRKLLLALTLGNLSEKVMAERVWTRKTQHEMEAGVVLWNKKQHFVAMLVACTLNSKPFSDIVYQRVLGDKETFWLAHEALGEPYEWYPYGGSAIGVQRDSTTVCGSLLHIEAETQRPLWFNGGLQVNKDFPDGQQLLNMTSFSIDDTFDGLNWEWGIGDTSWCHSVINTGRIKEMDEDELDIVTWIQDSWIDEDE